MLLYLGSFCAVAVGICYQLDTGVLHTAMCQSMA